MVNAEEWFMAYSKKKILHFYFFLTEENQNNKKKIQEIKERKVFDRTKNLNLFLSFESSKIYAYAKWR